MDAVRGVAVCGILFRNIFAFGIPTMAYSLPTIWGDGKWRDVLSWAFVEVAIDGSMRALFSLLFGATAMLLLSSIDQAKIERIDLYFRRAMWLMAFGLMHSFLFLCSFDILFIYGVLGLFLVPFRNLSAKALLSIATAGIILSAIMLQFQNDGSGDAKSSQIGTIEESLPVTQLPASDQSLSPSQQAQEEPKSTFPTEADDNETEMEIEIDLNGSNSQFLSEYFDPIWLNEVDEMTQDYLSVMASLAQLTLNNYSTEMLTTHFTDIGILFFVGMAFLKLGIMTGTRSTRFYILLCLGGYGVGLTINSFETLSHYALITQNIQSPVWTAYTYDIGRIATTFGHLGLIILMTRVPWLGLLTRLFAAAGRMALTNYLMQTILCIGLFMEFGFGFFGEFEHFDLVLIAICISCLQLVLSAIYLKYFEQGPAEWLLRALCNWNLSSGTKPISIRAN